MSASFSSTSFLVASSSCKRPSSAGSSGFGSSAGGLAAAPFRLRGGIVRVLRVKLAPTLRDDEHYPWMVCQCSLAVQSSLSLV